jgi:transcriptional antiterminator RfaH
VIRGEPILHWYLIHTKPLAERVAQINLERQGYCTYLPQARQRRRGRQERCARTSALFPRYLFLRLAVGLQSLQPIYSTVGVSTIVRFGARCAIVRDELIDKLRSRADPISGFHALEAPSFVPGSHVRIKAGPFCGIDGIFERQDGTERVTILIRLLGQERPLEFPSEFVQLAAS